MDEQLKKPEAEPSFDPTSITRPDPVLMKYYLVVSLLTGPALPFTLLPLLCKYLTLRYKFDEEGVSMRWGVLFRREVHLTYRRIQDIHLDRNLIQRWMGLATVGIQTASGSARPEMSIEGILAAERLRDHLYAKMRGARGQVSQHRPSDPNSAPSTAPDDEALVLLREIRDSLRQLGSSREAQS